MIVMKSLFPSLIKSKSSSTLAVKSIQIISEKCFKRYSNTVSPKSVNTILFFCFTVTLLCSP